MTPPIGRASPIGWGLDSVRHTKVETQGRDVKQEGGEKVNNAGMALIYVVQLRTCGGYGRQMDKARGYT